MQHTYIEDTIEEKDFISKEKILKFIPEVDIYKLIFGFKPKEYDYVTSPFRDDTKPGCWFEYQENGRLYFRDFGSDRTSIDCFEAIQTYYKLPNFYETLLFLYNHFIEGKDIVAQNNIVVRKPRQEVKIYFESRDFIARDRIYWEKYEITRQNLIDDKVFPVHKYFVVNSKNGDIKKRVHGSCYAYTDFLESRKKLYFPYKKDFRFLTNCRRNDIGNVKHIPNVGRQLVITKSYKDCRVLRNQGLYCIWLQNEGMIPDDDILIPILKGYREIIVWYDNDRAGIKASQKLSTHINTVLKDKSRPLWLPESLNPKGISDPSDLICKKNRKELNEFIKEKL